MTRQYLKDLQDGDAIDEVYRMADKQLRANRNANLYLLADLRDKTGGISGLMWNVTEDSVAHVQPGDFVRIRGKAQSYQGNLQVIMTNIRPVEPQGLDVSEFEAAPMQELEDLYARMRDCLLDIETPALRGLMECFLIDDSLMQAFRRVPAGIKAHHAYHGGLLEHVATLLEVAHRLRDVYPEVDFDLLLVGIFLHDIGKIRELEYEPTFAYSDEGQLLGHLVIAVEMLNAKIAEYERLTGNVFPEETTLRLKHMVLSHHGEYEYGSPKLPMTPEAIALHHLDNLDAKIHEFSRSIAGDPNRDSHWTPYSNRLARKLFKGSGKDS